MSEKQSPKYKYRAPSYATLMKLAKKYGYNSVDDYVSDNIGTEKTKEWSRRIIRDSTRN